MKNQNECIKNEAVSILHQIHQRRFDFFSGYDKLYFLGFYRVIRIGCRNEGNLLMKYMAIWLGFISFFVKNNVIVYLNICVVLYLGYFIYKEHKNNQQGFRL